MLRIEARRWVAIWWRCPQCGAQSADLMLTPWGYRHLRVQECHSYKHERCSREIVERRWYTTFAIEPGISFSTTAGTLEKIGPFKLCDIVHPNIRVFKRWYWRRKREEAEKTRQYLERERQIEAEWRARRERERQEAALLQEAEAVVYQRAHAAELSAEQVARAAWPVENQPSRQVDPGVASSLNNDDDFDPFLDTE
jgi:hypothetical protein